MKEQTSGNKEGDGEEEKKEGETGKAHLSKQEKQALFKALCEKGPKIVIDCEFDDLMQERELKSLSQQLAYCHATNKKLKQPLNLYFTGVGPKLKQQIQTQNCQNWAVELRYKEGTSKLSEYLQHESDLPRSQLVYLSADSENLLESLDPSSIYIIGGIVDHNRHKKLTFNQANEQGVRHARLPIRESGVNLTTSCVLTVNHVVDIIAQYYDIGGGAEKEVWKQALEKAIPERKRGVEPTQKKEDQSELKKEGESEKQQEEEKE